MKLKQYMNEITDGEWLRMSNAQKMSSTKIKHGASAFEDRFKELKKKKDIEGLKKLKQVSNDVGHRNIVKMIDQYLSKHKLSEMALTSKEEEEFESLKKSKKRGRITKLGLSRLRDLEDREWR
jgi:hypothetical protein